ncbi:MAG: glycosyltransferase family 2 protein [Desulfovibrio sp.]|nr:glycosyltransferase family 2 protein [Desulfovibrio sp.]
MDEYNLFALISASLPPEVDPAMLKVACPPGWWTSRPEAAAAYALRKCKYLDWNAYLANNPDLRDLSVDPVTHFLKDGLYEGRKLYYCKENHKHHDTNSPVFSIILYCKNDELYIDKSFHSITHQHFDNIEIFIIDDASDDNSLKIIQKFCANDKRIRVLSFS